jgi:hypothetical protein
MNLYIKSVPYLFFSSLLLGCASNELGQVRVMDNNASNIEARKEISKTRAIDIAENETYFTNKLRCIGDGQELKKLALRISVSPIYDKTGKAYPVGSTAISDMVLNSLSYVKAVSIVETPLSGEISESRTNIMSSGYKYLSKAYKDNVVAIANRTSHVPFGFLFPSNLYITGALVQYDEGSETPNPALQLDLDVASIKKEVGVISVGLNLRLINSNDGEVLANSEKGKRGSVMLSNRVYNSKSNGNLFKIINSSAYGLDYSVSVTDPKHYVIQEMVDKGVAELLAVLPNENNCGEQMEVIRGSK